MDPDSTDSGLFSAMVVVDLDTSGGTVQGKRGMALRVPGNTLLCLRLHLLLSQKTSSECCS